MGYLTHSPVGWEYPNISKPALLEQSFRGREDKGSDEKPFGDGLCISKQICFSRGFNLFDAPRPGRHFREGGTGAFGFWRSRFYGEQRSAFAAGRRDRSDFS